MAAAAASQQLMSPVPEARAGWAQSHFWGINGLLLRAVSAAVPELTPQTLFPLRVPAVFVAAAVVAAAVRPTAVAEREVLGVMAAAAAAAEPEGSEWRAALAALAVVAL